MSPGVDNKQQKCANQGQYNKTYRILTKLTNLERIKEEDIKHKK